MGSLPKTLPHTSSDSGQRPARNQILGLIVASLLKLQHLRALPSQNVGGDLIPATTLSDCCSK